MINGKYTYAEILSQPKVWQAILNQFQATGLEEDFRKLASTASKPFIITGCGSTYSLALILAASLRQAGFEAWGFPASEVVFYPEILPKKAAFLIAVSRSGATTETLWAVENFRKINPDGKVIAITTQIESDLAINADILLGAEPAQEQSLAQTRSFTSMLLLGQAFIAALRGDQKRIENLFKLPDILTKKLPKINDLAKTIGSDLTLQRFFFLGSGPYYGLACEAMMKTKEMTLTWAEGFHVMEFRHGPMSQVNEETLIVGLLSEKAFEQELNVIRDMNALGGKTLVLSEGNVEKKWKGMDWELSLQSGLSDWDRGVLYLPFIQLMAYYRSIAKGLNPDLPENLSMYVKL